MFFLQILIDGCRDLGHAAKSQVPVARLLGWNCQRAAKVRKSSRFLPTAREGSHMITVKSQGMSDET
jgi:hypothetical protein